jgi:hypothetical protein
MSRLLLPPMFRKSSSNTVNAAYTKKAPTKSLLIFKLKSPSWLSQYWFLCRDSVPDHTAASIQDFKWQQRQNNKVTLTIAKDEFNNTFQW